MRLSWVALPLSVKTLISIFFLFVFFFSVGLTHPPPRFSVSKFVVNYEKWRNLSKQTSKLTFPFYFTAFN